MKRPRSVRHRLALVVSLGVLATACGPTTPEDPVGEAGLSIVRQASYGGDLGSAIGSSVATGSTLGKTNELTPTCHDPAVAHTAPDVSFTWKAPYTDTFIITTEGSTFDTILGVRTFPASMPVGCNHDASPSTQQSSLALNLTGGNTYIITVDGHGSSVGSFQLNIDSASCPGACKPPQTGCYGPSFCDTSAPQCVYTYLEAGTGCDDQNPATSNDVCDGFGGCSGAPVPKPPNIHFIIDTSGSLRELPQVINSRHSDFFAFTINGCENPFLDAVSAAQNWSPDTVQPLPDPGTGLGSDTGFPNLFQDDKFYAYMSWGDSSNPTPQWTTKEAACQARVPNWSTNPEYNTCRLCLGSKGYFKLSSAMGSNTQPINLDFILWGRFLNFNPPKYVSVRAALKQVLKEVKNARVGHSYFLNTTPSSSMGKSMNPSCSLILSDPNAFDPNRASYINDINGLFFNTSTPMARALLNSGYYFTSGDDIYKNVFGFGTSYSYPNGFRNSALTSEGRSWCWGDQASAIVLVSEGEPGGDALGSALASMIRMNNGGPVYCPDSEPCSDGNTPDKGWDPYDVYDDNPNYMLDDVAKLLATRDLQQANPPVVGNFDTSGQQSLRIHTISYGYQSNLLRNAAAVGNGLYFTAQDKAEMQSALRNILCTMGAKTSACP